MVLGDDEVYGAEVFESRSRETVFRPGASDYRLVCLSLKETTKPRKPNEKQRRQQGPKPEWTQHINFRVGELIRAADRLYAAGSPDIVDLQDPHAAWEGRKGGILGVYSTEDGQKLAEYELAAPPAWDGMAAANGRLFISACDGSVICLD